jgi:hypothetical protein
MTLRLVSVCSLALLITTAANADRVYKLVDYPANQMGHTLNGTITTTDDAPNDSLLDVAEILSWQWSISGPNSFAANSSEFLTNNSMATAVRITTESIALPVANLSNPGPYRLSLSRLTSLGSRGQLSHELSWLSANTPSAGTTNHSYGGRMSGDAIQSYWSGPATFPSSSGWIVAVAVPEPVTGVMLSAVAIVGAVWRRLR